MRLATLWFALMLITACERRPAEPGSEDTEPVVTAEAKRSATGVILKLHVGPRSMPMDDITYAHAATAEMELRAVGTIVAPLRERYQGTLSGGDITLELPAMPGISSIELRGFVSVRNVDGSELQRLALPGRALIEH